MGFSNTLRVNDGHAAVAKSEQRFSRRNHPARATKTAAEVIYLAIDFIECLPLTEHGRKQCSHRSFLA